MSKQTLFRVPPSQHTGEDFLSRGWVGGEGAMQNPLKTKQLNPSPRHPTRFHNTLYQMGFLFTFTFICNFDAILTFSGDRAN